MMMASKPEIEMRDRWGATNMSRPAGQPPGVVHLWRRSLHASSAKVNSCYGTLSNEKKERALRFRIERPRQDFVLTRGALRSSLARYLGSTPQHVRLRNAENGESFLEGENDLCFNLSHTDGLALLAFVRGRAIRVDREQQSRKVEVEQLAERLFSKREVDDLKAPGWRRAACHFFRCGTRKAYIRARGEGLSLPLDHFDVSVAKDECRLLATRPDASEAGRWTLCALAVCHGYTAAWALAKTTEN